MLIITKGDTAVLQLTATDGDGNPVDLTGATFSTKIKGPSGSDVTFANAKHAADPDQNANKGKFTLSLDATDTESLEASDNKEIVTKVTQGSTVTQFRGVILNVLPAEPQQ